MKYLVSVFMALSLSNEAYAYCSQPKSYIYSNNDDYIFANLDYLICLHNEQVDAINTLSYDSDYSDAINNHASLLDNHTLDLKTQNQAIIDAVNLIKQLSAEVENLKTEIEELKAQVE